MPNQFQFILKDENGSRYGLRAGYKDFECAAREAREITGATDNLELHVIDTWESDDTENIAGQFYKGKELI
jgi:hypothetical protein